MLVAFTFSVASEEVVADFGSERVAVFSFFDLLDRRMLFGCISIV
jgi:hypothetical protein